MLTSITPLGERGRGSRWGVTFAFMLLGGAAGGALVGLLAGALGSIVLGDGGDAARLVVLGVLLAVAMAFDLGVGGLRLPTVRRQVDERWLTAYRGWVYGLGFGFQLGTGVATIVSTAAVYVVLAACLLTGDPLLGAAIGALFGTVRAATLLAAIRVTDPSRLVDLGSRLARWEPRARRMGLAVQLVLCIAALVAAGSVA
jgi:hypothetical protein